jgi:hypothetical protein
MILFKCPLIRCIATLYCTLHAQHSEGWPELFVYVVQKQYFWRIVQITRGICACTGFFLSTVVTFIQSAPLKKRVIFTLSAPIRTPLNIYFSACRTNPQGQDAL